MLLMPLPLEVLKVEEKYKQTASWLSGSSIPPARSLEKKTDLGWSLEVYYIF